MPTFETPSEAIESKIAPYRKYLIAAYVTTGDPNHFNKAYATPTIENVTVFPADDSTWKTFTVVYAIDGKPARECMLWTALLEAMGEMQREIDSLREREDSHEPDESA